MAQAKQQSVTKPAVIRQKKPKPAPVPVPEVVEAPAVTSRVWPWWLKWSAGVAAVLVLLAAGFELMYAGKALPGVTADGINVSGLSRDAVAQKLSSQTSAYLNQAIPIVYGKTTLRVPVSSLAAKYDTNRAAELAVSYGRQGSLWQQLKAQIRTLVGRPTSFAAYSFDDGKLTPYLDQVSDDVSTPVSDAKLSFDNGQAAVAPAAAGNRLDLGQLAAKIDATLAATSLKPVAANVYQLAPVVSTQTLANGASQASKYVSGPITLSSNTHDYTISQADITSWITVRYHLPGNFLVTSDINDLDPGTMAVTFGLDNSAVTGYVANLASKLDQSAQNAGLSMQNGQLSVVQASKNGVKLDQAGAVAGIMAALAKPSDNRQVNLSLQTTRAAVNEDNLNQLGITDQLSEGETSFPGSPSTRLINVRAGAAKFNGVLLAPGEVFSFGKLLGEVDASTGYVPELVILGDHEEKQYGGGLCQVSTTAFRAALLAGLPINERVNHAFAISYYTWPYGVPGVDATIYYPQVDLKFTNDTGHYLLMQTVMSGTDLKFDFYGTKTKTGVVRGPQFVSGSSDATQPSHTVFYRDVMDLSGNVIKTDKFDTYYKPSTDFPITKQFN